MTMNFGLVKILPATLFLGACALPLPFQIASLVADGISYVATKKSVTDHGLSIVRKQDCAVHRIMSLDPICSEYPITDGPQTAENPAATGAGGVRSAAPAEQISQVTGSVRKE